MPARIFQGTCDSDSRSMCDVCAVEAALFILIALTYTRRNTPMHNPADMLSYHFYRVICWTGKLVMELFTTLSNATVGGGGVENKVATSALRDLSIGLCRGNSTLYRRA